MPISPNQTTNAFSPQQETAQAYIFCTTPKTSKTPSFILFKVADLSPHHSQFEVAQQELSGNGLKMTTDYKKMKEKQTVKQP